MFFNILYVNNIPHNYFALFTSQFSSGLQDDFLVIHVQNDYDSILESVFKTEFLTLLAKKYENITNKKLKVDVQNKYER